VEGHYAGWHGGEGDLHVAAQVGLDGGQEDAGVVIAIVVDLARDLLQVRPKEFPLGLHLAQVLLSGQEGDVLLQQSTREKGCGTLERYVSALAAASMRLDGGLKRRLPAAVMVEETLE